MARDGFSQILNSKESQICAPKSLLSAGHSKIFNFYQYAPILDWTSENQIYGKDIKICE